MGIDTSSFAKNAFNRWLYNLNLASTAAYLACSQLRQQVERVFTYSLTKGTFYHTH
ncbi:MAG: hypothetical protein WA240_14105 [Nitrospirota bacterium]